jgi:hypothetical protein
MAIIPSNMRKVESALEDLRSFEVLIRRGKRRAAFTGPNGSSKLNISGQLIGQENDQRMTRMRQIILNANNLRKHFNLFLNLPPP